MINTEKFFADMKQRGLSKKHVAPSIIQYAWALGMDVSPPLYWQPGAIITFLGGAAGAFIAGWILTIDALFRREILPWWFYIGIFVGSVLIASGATLGANAYVRRKAGPLPPWRHYVQR